MLGDNNGVYGEVSLALASPSRSTRHQAMRRSASIARGGGKVGALCCISGGHPNGLSELKVLHPNGHDFCVMQDTPYRHTFNIESLYTRDQGSQGHL